MAYLSKTYSQNAGSRKIFTVSAWVKRSKLGSNQDCVSAYRSSDGLQTDVMRFQSDNKFQFYAHTTNSSGNAQLSTNRVFKDINAWYHIVVRVDTTQSTASDRIRLYVNGVQETSFSTETYMSQNGETVWGIGSGVSHQIGAVGASNNFKGLMTHIHYCDGQSLAPTSFGSTDSTTGIWKPTTNPSVTYGTNGFFLNFEDSSSFGDDTSGNGNDYTLTSGTITQTIDTPSNVFATLNPLVRNKSYNDGTLTNGNLGFAPNGRAITCSTLGVTSGKYYAEFKATDAGAMYFGAGLMKGITSQGQTNPIWYDNAEGFAIAIANNGNLESGTNQGSTSYGPTFADNDIIGIALDMDNKEMYIHKNGTYMNSGDPTSGASKTGGVTGATNYNPFDDGEEVFFMVADISAGGVGECQCNFGNGYFGTQAVASAGTNAGVGTFEYDVPSGYKALCTKNINAEEYS